MTGLGIYHYGARFYSPKLGRFLSADTIVPNAANPQDFNRYSYVRNNPVRYIDPTGHVCSDPDDPNRTCESGRKYPSNARPLGNSKVNGPSTPLVLDLKQEKPRGGGPRDRADETVIGGAPLPSTVTPTLVPTITPDLGIPDPLEPGLEAETVGGNNYSTDPNPVISIVGAVLSLQLAVIDTALAIGIISLARMGPLGWVIDAFALIPLEFVSLNLTIFAAQMAYYGSTDHDPLPILHLIAPDVLPYTPVGVEH